MILVTGGAGYIGVVLVKELLKKGISVRIFDKLYFGEKPLEEFRDRIDLVQGDIRNFDRAILNDIDAVAHLAGLSNDPTAEFNPAANMEMNAKGTAELATVCKEKGIRKFTYASSCSIYDRGLFAEDLIQDENAPVQPRAAYAISKYKGERALLELADEDFYPVILRQGTVYGYSPRMRYDLVVNTFVKDALQKGKLTVFCGGEMWRPLIDITDAAGAHICCLEADETKIGGNIYNISYKNYRILEVAYRVKKALEDIVDVEIDVDYFERKTRSYRVSTKKIETELGFKPTVSIEDSARDMAHKIIDGNAADMENPLYYNINWMTLLVELEQTLKEIGTVF